MGVHVNNLRTKHVKALYKNRTQRGNGTTCSNTEQTSPVLYWVSANDCKTYFKHKIIYQYFELFK